MATLKQIRQRIRTSKNIRQITRAMKLVAAARLTRAKNKVEEARPYSEKMREFMGSVSGGGSLPSHPLLERREVKTITLVLITAERGLAGSYNTALTRKAEDWIKLQTEPVSIIAVGKKGSQYFSKRGYNVVETLTVPTAGARLEDAVEVTEKVSKLFTEGGSDAIYLCFSRFFSPIRQEPRIIQLLPIEPPEATETSGSSDKDYQFEPAPKDLLGLLLPKYVLTLVLQTMLESSASEHGARMTAMSNATDNAGKMINDLTLQANRSRQAGITKEILEIVGGAEALKA
jgi:F-type H+-transporting ATPase subunit gamma